LHNKNSGNQGEQPDCVTRSRLMGFFRRERIAPQIQDQKMSISTAPVSASGGLQHGQQAMQPLAGRSASGVELKAPASTPTAEIIQTPATKSVVDARESNAAKVSIEQTRQSLHDINKALDTLSISVQFQIDPAYKEVIIKVVDQENGKVIRQIPSEDVVRIAKAMDNLKGLLFAQSV
jgi:flagellar protein FlaG